MIYAEIIQRSGLNNKSGVSTATKQLVLEAAEKYGYNFTRVSSRQGWAKNTYFIDYRKHGAIVNDNPFFAEISESIEQACKDRELRRNFRYLSNQKSIRFIHMKNNERRNYYETVRDV